MDERKILLARDDGRPSEVAGTVVIMANCGHRCLIGQAALSATLDPSIKTSTICLPCSGLSLAKLREMGLAGQIGALPGIREELAGTIGKEATEAMFKLLHVREDL